MIHQDRQTSVSEPPATPPPRPWPVAMCVVSSLYNKIPPQNAFTDFTRNNQRKYRNEYTNSSQQTHKKRARARHITSEIASWPNERTTERHQTHTHTKLELIIFVRKSQHSLLCSNNWWPSSAKTNQPTNHLRHQFCATSVFRTHKFP